LSNAIFSSFAKNGLCLSQVIAFSGYGIFRLEPFLGMAFSGSAKKQGYCIFRYAIFSHPVLGWGREDPNGYQIGTIAGKTIEAHNALLGVNSVYNLTFLNSHYKTKVP
jgi:hypothetical protein